MTLPDPVIKGASLHIVRRTFNGISLLRPDPVANRIIRFAFAYTIQSNNMGAYSFCALSDHYHSDVHDPDGNHPDFRRDLNSLLTRSLNPHHQTTGPKWDPAPQKPVILGDAESLLEHISYTCANMCHHGLVETPEDWPGFVSLVEHLAGPPIILKKPKGFYDPTGEVPDTVELRFIKPPLLAHLTDEEYRDDIARRVQLRVEAARRSREKRGVGVLGRLAILDRDPATPTPSPRKPYARRPVISCACKTLRQAILKWLTAFRDRYARQRVNFEAGKADVVFPKGTYLLAKRYRVKCETTGPPIEAIA